MALISDLYDNWTAYRATPGDKANPYSHYQMGELVSRSIDTIRQLEESLAGVRRLSIAIDGAQGGLPWAIKEVVPLLVYGQNSLAYELREHWNAHAAGKEGVDVLDPIIEQTVQAFNRADYLLDEAEGNIPADQHSSPVWADLEELRALLFPVPEPQDPALV